MPDDGSNQAPSAVTNGHPWRRGMPDDGSYQRLACALAACVKRTAIGPSISAAKDCTRSTSPKRKHSHLRSAIRKHSASRSSSNRHPISMQSKHSHQTDSSRAPRKARTCHQHAISTSPARHQHVISTSSARHQRIISTSSARHQHVISTSSDDQHRQS